MSATDGLLRPENSGIVKSSHGAAVRDRFCLLGMYPASTQWTLPLVNPLTTSDMCSYLSEQGLQVRENLQWAEGEVLIYGEYLTRILDNVASNILKYADAQVLVLIWDKYYADEMWILFENACGQGDSGMESYSIGLRNVKMMMEEMGGNCEVVQNGEQFRINLRFRYKEADRK